MGLILFEGPCFVRELETPLLRQVMSVGWPEPKPLEGFFLLSQKNI